MHYSKWLALGIFLLLVIGGGVLYGPRVVKHVYCTQEQSRQEKSYPELLTNLKEQAIRISGKIVAYNNTCYIGSGCYVELDSGAKIITRTEADLPTCPSTYYVPEVWGTVRGISFTDADLGKTVEVYASRKDRPGNELEYTLHGSEEFYLRVLE